MISRVTKKVGGEPEAFRMTTRAMMAIEQESGKGIVRMMEGLEEGFRITDLVLILSECGEDGAGMSRERAAEIVDQIGFMAAGELLGEIAEAAFPEAKGGAAKNAKGAARSK